MLSSGIRGRHDRWGRILGAACVGVPLTVVIAVITAVIGGHVSTLAATLGAALGLLWSGTGDGRVVGAHRDACGRARRQPVPGWCRVRPS